MTEGMKNEDAEAVAEDGALEGGSFVGTGEMAG